jgi:molecular chaperone DnaK (HSP70)
MGKCIGIDLGTTNTVGAVIDGPRALVLVNRENTTATRSVVSLRRRKGKEDELLCGNAALDNWPMAPRDTIISIKRLMGRGVDDPEVKKVIDNYQYKIVIPSDGTKDSVRVVMGGKQYSPVQISAMILKKIKEDAEFRLKEEVTDAVITVPAYFSQAQKGATRRAGQEAGLRVIQILDEPTAAAIAYGMENSDSKEPQYILVYDLGGGTFDISVLLWDRNVFVPMNLEGDMWLGGDDFDQKLLEYAVSQIQKEYGVDPRKNERFMVALRCECKKTKETLSAARSAEIIVSSLLVDATGNLIDVVVEVTRDLFENLIRPLVDRTISLVEKALSTAGLDVDLVSCVLMAGNSTCVPLVQQEVQKKFGAAKVLNKMHPKQCVAIGAAKLAAVLYGKLVCQAPDPSNPKRECGFRNEREATQCGKCGAPLVWGGGNNIDSNELIPPGGIAPYPYGIQTAGDKYSIFISKSDPFPTPDDKKVPQTLFTRLSNQRIILLPVYGGENVEKASANQKQGQAVAILPSGVPKGTPIRIRVWLDVDGVFDLSAHLEDGTDLKPWIVKGENDELAIDALQNVEGEFRQIENQLSADEHAEAQRVRNEAFNDLRAKNFDQARQRTEDFKNAIAGRKKNENPLARKAEGLIRYTRFIIDRYGWLLSSVKILELEQFIEQTEQAIAGGDPKILEEKTAILDKATDLLPGAVLTFVHMFMAIQSRISPRDPVVAASLLDALSEAEQALKTHSPDAELKIKQLASKISVFIDQIGDAPDTNKLVCSCGTEIPMGANRCPKCGELAGLVEDRSGGAAKGI